MGGETIFILVYVVISLFVGWKIMSGRIAWCEERGVPNKIVKIILSLIVGSILWIFFVVFWIVRGGRR